MVAENEFTAHVCAFQLWVWGRVLRIEELLQSASVIGFELFQQTGFDVWWLGKRENGLDRRIEVVVFVGKQVGKCRRGIRPLGQPPEWGGDGGEPERVVPNGKVAERKHGEGEREEEEKRGRKEEEHRAGDCQQSRRGFELHAITEIHTDCKSESRADEPERNL
jgi:hypothetical protein